MHVDDYNETYRNRVMIRLESKVAPYFASLQVDWTEEMAHVDIHVVSSESFEEGDEDEQFFKQEPPHDKREFMVKIWEG